MTDKVFRVGGMGTGRIFNHAHVPAYVNLDSVELAAVYDPDRDAAQQTREHYLSLLAEISGVSPAHVEVAVCDSPEDLLAQVDMIDVCAPVR